MTRRSSAEPLPPVVIDASALLDYLLHCTGASTTAVLIEQRRHRLHAPALLDVEVLSMLRRHQLGGQMTEARAREALADCADLPITRHEHSHLLQAGFDLREAITAYDAMYIALALRLGARLHTVDRRLRRAVEAAVPGLSLV